MSRLGSARFHPYRPSVGGKETAWTLASLAARAQSPRVSSPILSLARPSPTTACPEPLPTLETKARAGGEPAWGGPREAGEEVVPGAGEELAATLADEGGLSGGAGGRAWRRITGSGGGCGGGGDGAEEDDGEARPRWLGSLVATLADEEGLSGGAGGRAWRRSLGSGGGFGGRGYGVEEDDGEARGFADERTATAALRQGEGSGARGGGARDEAGSSGGRREMMGGVRRWERAAAGQGPGSGSESSIREEGDGRLERRFYYVVRNGRRSLLHGSVASFPLHNQMRLPTALLLHDSWISPQILSLGLKKGRSRLLWRTDAASRYRQGAMPLLSSPTPPSPVGCTLSLSASPWSLHRGESPYARSKGSGASYRRQAPLPPQCPSLSCVVARSSDLLESRQTRRLRCLWVVADIVHGCRDEQGSSSTSLPLSVHNRSPSTLQSVDLDDVITPVACPLLHTSLID